MWVAENRANKIAMFDTKTQETQEWAVPDPTYFPYAATADKYGEAWAVTEYSDAVLRLDTKTGQFTEYLMPRETNMRRAVVEDSGPQVKFWVGNTHQGAIVRVEPLDGPAVAKAMKPAATKTRKLAAKARRKPSAARTTGRKTRRMA